jgi:hypothetical protein
MKCEQCQRLILIQDLLEIDERESMNQHLVSCSACQKFQIEAAKINQIIGQASAFGNQPIKASTLTDKIMTRVMTPAPKKVSSQETWIFNPFTRFAFSGISVCLIVLFIIEWQSPVNAEIPKGPVAGLQQVILNSQSLRKEFSSKEKRKSLLSNCISPDKKQADIACLKEKMKSIQF